MRHFLCVLQTHSQSENQGYLGKKRYCGAEKPEIIRRCLTSLVRSINAAQDHLPWFSFELKVLDDHSDTTTIGEIQTILNQAKFPTGLSSLSSRGIMPSILACYQYGKDFGKDLVYFAQDDYLFFENAIEEMLVFDTKMSQKLQSPLSIYPFNDPYRYYDHNSHEFMRMVQGNDRHWRTNNHTASCFMTHASIIQKEWDLFHAMGISEVHPEMEAKTINRLWTERGYFLFTPIPSLALHMQYDTEKDPYIDWLSLWETFSPQTTPHSTYHLPDNKRILLNVGCGKVPLDITLKQSSDWTEVRVDNDPHAHPDIVASLDNIQQLPSHSVDAIWASHVLEHVSWHEIPGVIHEFKRLLKKDGLAVISVPDLEKAAEMIIKDQLLDTIYHSPGGSITPLDMLYGYRPYVQSGMDGMQHKTGFTKTVLLQVLKDLGFQYVLGQQGNFEIKAFASERPLHSEDFSLFQ